MYTNSTRRYPIAKALIALFSLLLASPALAASGTALGVKQSAALQTGTTTKVLTVGADIQIGDTVVTGPSGQVQIKFSDRTELVVGPNSSLVIEDYLLRSDNSPGNFAVKALGGTFRFVTGQAEKDRYRIATPTGTIGVRGTAVDFVVDPDQTRALLFHGAVILCNNAGQCVTLDDVCELGQYDLRESVVLGNADEITGARREALKGAFRYAQSQAPLLREFWVDNARECFNKGFVHQKAEMLVPGDTGPNEDQPQPPENCWYVEGELFCL